MRRLSACVFTKIKYIKPIDMIGIQVYNAEKHREEPEHDKREQQKHVDVYDLQLWRALLLRASFWESLSFAGIRPSCGE